MKLMKMVLKLADISNEVRPLDVSAAWIDRLLHEFFHQARLEKLLALPVTPFMDPERVHKAASQVPAPPHPSALFAGAKVRAGIMTIASWNSCIEFQAGIPAGSYVEFLPINFFLQNPRKPLKIQYRMNDVSMIIMVA